MIRLHDGLLSRILAYTNLLRVRYSDTEGVVMIFGHRTVPLLFVVPQLQDNIIMVHLNEGGLFDFFYVH